LTFTSCATIQGLLSEPTVWETVSALKEVLNTSVFRAIDKLAKLNQNGVESIIPEEIKPVLATLRTLGLGDEIDRVTKSIGDASEIALTESKGLVSDAIKEVKFEDAAAVVMGGPDAATLVMKNAMYEAVKKRYSDRLNVELEKTDVNKYWPMAQSAHNIFAKNKVEGSLSDFLAAKAVDGLFIAIGKEEAVIRKNPNELGSAVVDKVFDYYNRQKQGNGTSLSF
tara:strand:- start:254 stop:928 length:675 start_codon:yes stop_codon:yes gene_type:complete